MEKKRIGKDHYKNLRDRFGFLKRLKNTLIVGMNFKNRKVNNEPVGSRYNTATVAIGAVGLGFVPSAGQIGHSVANGSQLLRRFFVVRAGIAHALT